MDMSRLKQTDDFEWTIEPHGDMQVPAIIYADRALMQTMDDKVYEQVTNVAKLPGIVKASFAMPDAHWGYGFPIGGVAAFAKEQDGVISAGGVGFDISCGVRAILTGLKRSDIDRQQIKLADALFATIPVGLGSRGQIALDDIAMDAMLAGGAAWAVGQGYGHAQDLLHIEENGCMQGAKPEHVSHKAKQRQYKEMGTLGSGNHYLEIQEVVEIYDDKAAQAFGLHKGEIIISIHCGSRGLGHQIGTDYLREMVMQAPHFGITLPDRELACAPIASQLGQQYLGAMRAGINCSFANRQIIMHLVRQVFSQFYPHHELKLLFDVSHNTCKVESHLVDGKVQQLYVHRKGATRAFGPTDKSLPADYRHIGQPVLIGGSMGTSSYVLVGIPQSQQLAFSSACHGAGRAMSRRQANKRWHGRQVIDELAARGIQIRSPSYRDVAEEAPDAYKDVTAVVDAADKAHLAHKVAKLHPVICVKG